MNILCFDIASGGITGAILDPQLHAARLTETPWMLESGTDGAAALPVPAIIERFKTAIRQLQPGPADRIGAVCIDSFMHNCVLLDADDEPLTPVFTWLDQRGSDGIELIRSRLGDRFHETTGCRFHPMFPVFKLASMRLANAMVLQSARRIVSIKSLLVHKLTGVWLEDHGIASASGLYNVLERRWHEEVLDILGLKAGCLPEVASRDRIAGRVTPSAAAQYGIAPGTPVVNGTGDGFATNVGSSCEVPESICVTLGTSAVVRQTLSQPALVPDAGTFCYMADEKVYLLGCAGNNGGNVLDWGRNIFSGADEKVATDPPIFVPLLHGERSPEWNPALTGSWQALKATHTAADLLRSVLEGVIFNLAYFLEIVQTVSSTRAANLILSGNGFLDPLAAPLFATIAAPVWMPEQPGLLTIRGAAICALRASGEAVPELGLRQILPLDDAKILRRYAEYRRFRGTLAREK